MPLKTRLYRFFANRAKRGLQPMQVIALMFLGIIAVGAGFLMLPAASRSGVSCGVLPALFTATSATCVTGLTLFDTWTQWSGFGQGVILCLIEVGGLGFMSAASIVIFLLGKRVSLRQKLLMAQALNVNDMDAVVKLQKWVIFGSLSVQAVGAMILFLRFLPKYGWARAGWWGVFHSVSAFCNAGFDVFGSISDAGSIVMFNSDPVVCITLMLLIVVGGLGFIVWEEVVRLHNWKKFSVYTKLVLSASAVLVVGGALVFCLLEWNNPATFGAMSAGDKILNAFFQSVTARTAGFVSVDQAGLTDAGKAVTMLLMLIGGSSGSTAGGMKTVTFVVLLLFMRTRLRGKDTVCVFRTTVPNRQVLDAVTIAMVMVGLALFGGVLVSLTSGISLLDSMYETISALATVGTTTGVTAQLNVASQILIIIYMYFGRVGVLTLSMGFLSGTGVEERYRYADTKLLIG